MSKGPAVSAIQQYKQLDVSSAVDSASPHRLIQMLMERALQNISLARASMEQEKIVEKGERISDAIGIINGLQASLNHKHDPKLSANFDELYGYMMRRLLEANLKNDKVILDEVSGLLRELKEAWDAIADHPMASLSLDEREEAYGDAG
ncbi:MAG: flagellar export chaperone FliS [Pseudomonadota bacterium]